MEIELKTPWPKGFAADTLRAEGASSPEGENTRLHCVNDSLPAWT